jgi:hypothetical protein
MKKTFLLVAMVILAMSGCGSPSGSTTDLKSVYLTISPSSDRLETDVLTGNSCAAGTSGTYTTATLPIVITSTAYPNSTTKSSVTINSVTISYSKYGTSSTAPALPVQYDTGGTISAGGSKTFNVKVATDKLKLDLVNTYGFNLCSLDYWEYYATITFNGVEDIGGKSFSLSTVVKVAFADRN